eukprot:superscaffoldBa00005623_g20581
MMFQKVEDLLSGFYTFYHTSPLNKANLILVKLNHFKPVLEMSGIHVERIPDQWTVLKALMNQEPQSLQKMFWFSVNRTHQHSCPD